MVSEHQHKGLSLLGRDERASRDDDDPLSPTPERKKKRQRRAGGRERERETFLGEDFLLSRCFSLDKGRGDNKELVFFFVRVFSTHQHGIFPITNGNHTEREREREDEDEENTRVEE